MKTFTLPLPYFGNILFYQTLFNHDCVIDIHEYYQKQSYRNRCEILTVQGKQNLSVPILKVRGVKDLVKNVQIDHVENWQKDHQRAVISAYGSAPFFEFYIDDLEAIWNQSYDSLFELNCAAHKIICRIMEWDLVLNFSTQYIDSNEHDYRPYFSKSGLKSSDAIEIINNLEAYTQVFKARKEYIANLSILDLIFNLGPESNRYLKKHG